MKLATAGSKMTCYESYWGGNVKNRIASSMYVAKMSTEKQLCYGFKYSKATLFLPLHDVMHWKKPKAFQEQGCILIFLLSDVVLNESQLNIQRNLSQG